MGYCNLDLEGQYKSIESNDNAVKKFEDKWKTILKLFEGAFFIKNDDGKCYLFCLPKESSTINSGNFSTLDDGKPNKDRALARFFSNIKKSEGDCDFGFGTKGFSDKFYTDLFNLCGGEYNWSVLSVVCDADGYYTGSFKLLKNGISETFDFIENEEEELS
jgi:hypothetical protein